MIVSILLSVFIVDAYGPPMSFDLHGIGIPLGGSLQGLISYAALIFVAIWITRGKPKVHGKAKWNWTIGWRW